MNPNFNNFQNPLQEHLKNKNVNNSQNIFFGYCIAFTLGVIICYVIIKSEENSGINIEEYLQSKKSKDYS